MNAIQQFTFKGSILIVIGILLANLIVVPVLTMLGADYTVATTIANGLISSFVVAYVTVYVDGNKERKTFVKRFVLFGILFAITCVLWGMGILI